MFVKKENGTLEIFDKNKIVIACKKAVKHVMELEPTIGNLFIVLKIDTDDCPLKKIADEVTDKAIELKDSNDSITVEEIHDIVQLALLRTEETTRIGMEYVLYRDMRKKAKQRNLFTHRQNVIPYDYPEVIDYVNAIRKSYWLHTHYDFTEDLQTFNTKLTPAEQETILRCSLAISQIEVNVKRFWSKQYDRFPKPEFDDLSNTFGESESRHTHAYQFIIEELGLQERFSTVLEVPAIQKRVKYLNNALANANSVDNKEYAETVLLFALFVENVSLFSQFYIVMSYKYHGFGMHGFNNVVAATSLEENIHAQYGTWLIQTLREENPGWFNSDHVKKVQDLAREAYEAEAEIVDWIFENGPVLQERDDVTQEVINPEADGVITAEEVKNFIKSRFNQSLESIDYGSPFEVDEKLLERSAWFETEINGATITDQFASHSTAYNKFGMSFIKENLFHPMFR